MVKTKRNFFVGYQEGDVIPKTESAQTALLAKALIENGLHYEVTDITKQTYDLLKMKRACALTHQAAFESEGYKDWFDMLMMQTDCIMEPYEKFSKKMARYIFVARK